MKKYEFGAINPEREPPNFLILYSCNGNTENGIPTGHIYKLQISNQNGMTIELREKMTLDEINIKYPKHEKQIIGGHWTCDNCKRIT